jgi:hypothetical protein
MNKLKWDDALLPAAFIFINYWKVEWIFYFLRALKNIVLYKNVVIIYRSTFFLVIIFHNLQMYMKCYSILNIEFSITAFFSVVPRRTQTKKKKKRLRDIFKKYIIIMFIRIIWLISYYVYFILKKNVK